MSTGISIPIELKNALSNPGVKNADLAMAVDTTQLTGEGNFTISRHGQIYTITGTAISSIKEGYLLLEKCRGAHPFEQDASWQQILNARGTLQGASALLVYQHQKIPCGSGLGNCHKS